MAVTVPQVATAVVAIVVDLSQPSQVLQEAINCIQLVRAKVQQSLTWLQQKGSQLPEQLRLRARKYVGSNHEDKDVIQHMGKQLCNGVWSVLETTGQMVHTLTSKAVLQVYLYYW